jgi:tRNA(Ile)-lysidine synthase
MVKTAIKPSMEQRILLFIKEHQLLKTGQKLVVAVSGGPDSVCMLDILVKLHRKLGIELLIAHLNHQLRGADSDADARYVADVAARLGIPAVIESRDVDAYRHRHRLTLEEAAREVRYSFLAEVARFAGTGMVAVGHTLDDHLETILMHLIRGSGTRGIRGLLPVSRWSSGAGGIIVIRPLLDISREETAAYCDRNRLEPRTDASNYSLAPLRNRIRHELLPQLREYNPGIAGALLRTARLAADDLAFIDGEVGKTRKKVSRKLKNAITFDKKPFRALPPSVQRHLLRTSIESLLGTIKDVEAAHIEEIMNLLDKPSGKKTLLPCGLAFTVEYDRYLLAPDSAALSPYPVLRGETRLNLPGVTSIPGWEIRAGVIRPPVKAGTSDEFTACFDFAETGDVLFLRSRRPGDCFQPLGMSETKKLNRFMIDEKIPQSWRTRIPIVVSPSRLIWVVGYRIDDGVRVTPDTASVLRLAFRRV